MNPQEDVGDSISYVHDEESMDIDDVPPQVTFNPPVLQEQRPLSPPTASLITPRPGPRLNGHINHHTPPYQAMIPVHGASIRDNEMSSLRAEQPNSSRGSRSTTRSPTHSPPPTFNPTQGPSRLIPTERLATSPAGSEGSSAGAFFRTYQHSSVDGRPGGTLTPDLVFAEIGHGHGPVGWHGQEQPPQFVDPATLTVDDRPPPYNASATYMRGGGAWRAAAQGTTMYGANGALNGGSGALNGTYRASASHSVSTNGMSSHGVNGTGVTPAVIQGPPMSREERSRGRPRTSREPQESAQAALTPPGSNQGRGPKRTLRNTLGSVEQHATSFLFGRSIQDGEGSSAGAAATRKDDSTRGY
jgi:hypothetical protein